MAHKFKSCSIDRCNGNSHYSERGARGWCCSHYCRWAKYGDPVAGGTSHGSPLAWIKANKRFDGDDCLIWPFSLFPNGYGQIRVGESSSHASRIMCQEAHGSPPTQKHEAAHNCGKGNAACVNPRHLRWDTAKGNCADRTTHGTENRGERQGRHKLTEDDVRGIRLLTGMTNASIAAIYGVNRMTICDIFYKRTWGWLE